MNVTDEESRLKTALNVLLLAASNFVTAGRYHLFLGEMAWPWRELSDAVAKCEEAKKALK